MTTDIKRAIESFVARLRDEFFRDPNGTYWVSVDLMMLLRVTRVPAAAAPDLAQTLLDVLLDAAGPAATLLISTFNFDFPRSRLFDVAQSPAQTGAFGSMLLARHAASRTPIPFYSFLVFGAQAEALLSRRFANSTGEDSVFEWMMARHTSLVTIGHHYVKAMTSTHHAEQIAGVSYRHVKLFSGQVVGLHQSADVEVTFFARDLELCQFSGMTLAGDAHLRTSRIIGSFRYQGERHAMMVYEVDLAAANRAFVASFSGGGAPFIDYVPVGGDNPDVITGQVADRLHLQDLAASATGSSISA